MYFPLSYLLSTFEKHRIDQTNLFNGYNEFLFPRDENDRLGKQLKVGRSYNGKIFDNLSLLFRALKAHKYMRISVLIEAKTIFQEHWVYLSKTRLTWKPLFLVANDSMVDNCVTCWRWEERCCFNGGCGKHWVGSSVVVILCDGWEWLRFRIPYEPSTEGSWLYT